MAEAFHRALIMPRRRAADAHARAAPPRDAVTTSTRWAALVPGALDEASAAPAERRAARRSSAPSCRRTSSALRGAPPLVLLLDYDGTLVPFARIPELATPDPDLLALLRALARRPGHGGPHRQRPASATTLERWFGDLPIGLHAEHGLWTRPPGATAWTRGRHDAGLQDWQERVLPHPRRVSPTARRARLSRRSPPALAWHYRMADPQYGACQANELRKHLTELLSNTPVEILAGDEVIELRRTGSTRDASCPASGAPAGRRGVRWATIAPTRSLRRAARRHRRARRTARQPRGVAPRRSAMRAGCSRADLGQRASLEPDTGAGPPTGSDTCRIATRCSAGSDRRWLADQAASPNVVAKIPTVAARVRGRLFIIVLLRFLIASGATDPRRSSITTGSCGFEAGPWPGRRHLNPT